MGDADWRRDRNPNWVLPNIIAGSTVTFICLCCLAYSIYVFRISRRNRKLALTRAFKLLNIFGIISFTTASILQCIYSYYFHTFYWMYSFTQTSTWNLMWFFWSTGQITSYWIFLNRIITSFHRSVHQVSKFTKYSIAFLITTYQFLWTLSSFLPFVFYIEWIPINREDEYRMEFYLVIPTTLMDLMIVCWMTFIFSSRLYRLILAQTTAEYEEQKSMISCGSSFTVNSTGSGFPSMIGNGSNGGSTPSSTFSSESFPSTFLSSVVSSPRDGTKQSLLKDREKKMIRVISKISILSVTSLVSSMTLVTLRAIGNVTSWPADSMLGIVLVFVFQIDTTISCLCLVLFLPKTEKMFTVLCCCCNRILSGVMKESLYHSTVVMTNKRRLQTTGYQPIAL